MKTNRGGGTLTLTLSLSFSFTLSENPFPDYQLLVVLFCLLGIPGTQSLLFATFVVAFPFPFHCWPFLAPCQTDQQQPCLPRQRFLQSACPSPWMQRADQTIDTALFTQCQTQLIGVYPRILLKTRQSAASCLHYFVRSLPSSHQPGRSLSLSRLRRHRHCQDAAES
ncbi:hypothetical protein LX32DRAFT_151906 [Colletotrichum zoysiae]|uniref:Uncharacterized protein n=1 Tax=Colletotrichum zoysiae TaxID=1216348 RepID=A0AAD9MAH1_9PEZI|nr:hypothetical protein LX32DRAFT_151906 [Colletotrichum zoysiae]